MGGTARADTHEMAENGRAGNRGSRLFFAAACPAATRSPRTSVSYAATDAKTLAKSAEKKWRRLNGHERIISLLEGKKFVNGEL